MPYYQGDFYPGRQGDFYRGDPGLFSFLGRAAKTAVGFIPGAGPVMQKAISVGTAIIKRHPSTGVVAQAGGIVKAGTAAIGRTVMKHPIVSAAAGAGVIGAMSGGIAGRATAPGMAMAVAGQRGYHISRKTGNLVRNRRMNPCNPRALRRAIRRAHGFTKLAMHTIHLIHPKKKARFGGFRKKRKR